MTDTDFPASGCNYLDARLTFRSAESTGLLEICNEEGQWSVACGSSLIPLENVMVICNQLGFDPNFIRVDTFQSNPVLRPITFAASNLVCGGNESNLTSCLLTEPQDPNPGFQKRLAEPLTCSSLEIQCGGKQLLDKEMVLNCFLSWCHISSPEDHF